MRPREAATALLPGVEVACLVEASARGIVVVVEMDPEVAAEGRVDPADLAPRREVDKEEATEASQALAVVGRAVTRLPDM